MAGTEFIKSKYWSLLAHFRLLRSVGETGLDSLSRE